MRPIWTCQDLPQRIKYSDKLWAEDAKPIKEMVYVLISYKKKYKPLFSPTVLADKFYKSASAEIMGNDTFFCFFKQN